MGWRTDRIDKFTMEDAQYIMSVAIPAVTRRGAKSPWSAITSAVSPELRSKFWHPVYDFFADTHLIERLVKGKVPADDFAALNKVIDDPFYALRLERGDALADSLINFSKAVFIKAFEEMERSSETQKPEIYARQTLWHRLRDVCDEDAKEIIFSGSFVRTCEDALYNYMTASERKRISGGKFTLDGKQKMIIPSASQATKGLFARQMAQEETGGAAQSKQPKARYEKRKVNPRGKPQDPSA